jgi:hypothetical protein
MLPPFFIQAQMRIISCQLTRLVQLKLELANLILMLNLTIIIGRVYEIQVIYMIAAVGFQNYIL